MRIFAFYGVRPNRPPRAALVHAIPLTNDFRLRNRMHPNAIRGNLTQSDE
ncbi:MAG: hypothetical protein ACOCX7_02945 [Bacteroidota bacterium]